MKKPHIFLPAFLACCVAVVAPGCASHQGSAARSIPAGPVYTAPAAPGVIPSGTDLVIRTNEAIDTDRAVPGRVYEAQVDRAIIDTRNETIVPAGSPAELIVVNTSSGGTVGTPQLELAVRSITVAGRKYDVVTDVSEQQAENEGLGRNRRTAETVGGGAILGTLIGAIAGGGTGAAIGAVAGAAGGAAVQVLTRGDHVRVPSETLLTFRLDRPIRLSGYRR
jgi:hypothetical protein